MHHYEQYFLVYMHLLILIPLAAFAHREYFQVFLTLNGTVINTHKNAEIASTNSFLLNVYIAVEMLNHTFILLLSF